MPAALPESFGQLTAMTFCDLEENALTGEHLRSTNSLLTLACTELPSTIGNLKALKTLSMHTNALKGEHSRSTNRPLVR